MHVPFEQTIRSLERQPGALSGWFLVAVLTLTAGWVLAALTFDIPISVESKSARLIAAQQPIDLKAPRPLPVKAVHVALGSIVESGELLIELDTDHWQAAREAAEQEITSLAAASSAVQREIDELATEATSQRYSATARSEEIQAERDGVLARTQRAVSDLGRLEAMGPNGAVAESSLTAARERVATLEAEARALEARAEQLVALAERERAELRRRRAALARQAALLDERRAEKQGEARRAQVMEGQGRIMAPARGRVGAIASLAPGTVVDTAEWLLTLVPGTPVSVEARFDPSAIGQLSPGQTAWLRLANGQRGLLEGLELRLDRVASEPREGYAAAKFSIRGNPQRVALQHGLEGQLTVEVRREPAAVLLLEALERSRPNWL